jgi:hypothetical protein
VLVETIHLPLLSLRRLTRAEQRYEDDQEKKAHKDLFI